MTTALYRRYRPETFEEVIGQEHVTGPLMQALRSNRVNHAYLFSGPRGCGKTTSARILARILNCAANTDENPRATPCGECESCIELGRGGSGSLDVVEIDAASHGGVDDARDLRERATFSPSRDRYKIFILDEAHMVTSAGFNALLKIVEEPPPYLKFIFATTEPEKVIGTIRSRTHHYPFRLVPPEVLQPYLETVCGWEDVKVGSGVLPLVVRAGGGSVRDSLSILDQLMAGAQGSTIDYAMAAGLLGFTPVTLLDDVVEALATSDGASLFRVVDQIIATGHEPRRFVEDLLERLRDLVVMAVSGDRADAVFATLPEDQVERMQAQAHNLGFAELSRGADIVNDALSEMTGATSPRLHLELLCARLLLPAADDGARGLAARVDQLERSSRTGEPVAPPSDPPARGAAPRVAAQQEAASAAAPAVARRPASTRPAPPDADPIAGVVPEVEPVPLPEPEPEPEPTPTPAPVPVPPTPEPAATAEEVSLDDAPVGDASLGDAHALAGAQLGGTEVLRRRWPEVLETLSRLRKATWALVTQNAQVHELSDDVLLLAFPSAGLATAFRGGNHAQLVRQAVHETLGFDVRVDGVAVDDAGAHRGGRESGEGRGGPGHAAARSEDSEEGDPAVDPDEPFDVEPVSSEPADAELSKAAPAEADPVDVAPVAAEAKATQPDETKLVAAEPATTKPADAPVTVPAAAPARAPRRPALSGMQSAAAATWGIEVSGSGADVVAAAEQLVADAAPVEPPPADEPPPLDEPPFAQGPPQEEPPVDEPPAGAPPVDEPPVDSRPADNRPASTPRSRSAHDEIEEATWDSVDVSEGSPGLTGAPLIAMLLGGRVIDEIIDEPED